MLFNRTVAGGILRQRQQPEVAELRRFVVELFSRDELETLCADYFREVYDDLEGAALTKTTLAQRLIDYCRRNNSVTQLRAALQKMRPEAFAQHFRLTPFEEPPRRARDANRIFISHAHGDRLIARRLAVDLHERNFDVWIAPDSIHPGESWVSAIDRGLHECGVYMLLLSPAAVKSSWVKSETRVAIQLEHQGKLRVLPLLLKTCNAAKLSAFLATYQQVSLSKGYERGFDHLLDALGGARGEEAAPVALALPVQPDDTSTSAAAAGADVAATSAPAAAPAGEARDAKSMRGSSASRAHYTLIDPLRMELIRIPAGSFWMGSHLKRDTHAQHNERPRHRVRLSEYFIGKHPVTNEQFAVFAHAAQHGFKLPIGKALHPVVNVSWDDARAFCDWLSGVTGQRFMLPSEAEWEKAARGTDGRIYPWGDAFDPTQLNSCEAGPRDTLPVGHFSPKGDSPYGVADLCGNVWEWCDDWFDDDAYAARARSRVQDPLGPPQGVVRSLRGGAFDFDQHAVRCAYRVGASPYVRSYDYGFRVIMRP